MIKEQKKKVYNKIEKKRKGYRKKSPLKNGGPPFERKKRRGKKNIEYQMRKTST